MQVRTEAFSARAQAQERGPGQEKSEEGSAKGISAQTKSKVSCQKAQEEGSGR